MVHGKVHYYKEQGRGHRMNINHPDYYEFFSRSFTIAEEHRPAVAAAIRKYAQEGKCPTDETIEELVTKSQSPSDTFRFLASKKPYNISQWRGHLAEWVACMEYNSRRNKDSNVVATIVNPHTNSKADLLHIIKTKDGFHCAAGPDIKTGKPNYLLNQLEKTWNHSGTVAFFDFNKVLQSPEKLTPGQQKRLQAIKEEHPKRKILTPDISPNQALIFSKEFLKYSAGEGTASTKWRVEQVSTEGPIRSDKTHTWEAFRADTVEEIRTKRKEEITKKNKAKLQEKLQAMQEEEGAYYGESPSNIPITNVEPIRPSIDVQANLDEAKKRGGLIKQAGRFAFDIFMTGVKSTASEAASQLFDNALNRTSRKKESTSTDSLTSSHETSSPKTSEEPTHTSVDRKSPREHPRNGSAFTNFKGTEVRRRGTIVNPGKK